METFFAIEPKAGLFVIFNLILWVGIGFVLYKLVSKRSKGCD